MNIVSNIIKYFGAQRIGTKHPQYLGINELKKIILSFTKLLFNSCQESTSWLEAIKNFCGDGIIPAMTIHKSKGLEYDIVFFIGLEDNAWFSFSKENKADQCAFFVAFSRAKSKVYFTFCENRLATRQSQTNVQSLHTMLHDAGVKEVSFA